jgi:ATP-dependent DNA ligase
MRHADFKLKRSRTSARQVTVLDDHFRKEPHMSSLFDRLNQELESFGKRAQAALDEGKSQIELMRVRRQRDIVARDLGLFVYRRERGGVSDQARYDALLLRFDDLEREIATLEHEAAATRSSTPATPAEPVGTPPVAEAEPVTMP